MTALLVALVALTAVPAAEAGVAGSPSTVAAGLELPWEVTLVPDGRIFVTERPDGVRVIEPGGKLRAGPAYTEPGVTKFLGLALHPDFATNRFVYLYETRGNANGSRVVRLTDDGTNLVNPVTIFSGIRSDGSHDGGRIKFGPDGKLYVTTGDVHDPSTPQDLDSLNGKILRLEAPGGAQDGAAPADNPFNAPGETRARRFVWSYGHRHPQGIDWDGAGRMWETEHGPSGEPWAGGRGSRDEINRIEPGANYGWPEIMGDETREGMRSPVVSSGDSTTWAPGGLAVGPDGRLYVPMLAGQHLRSFSVGCNLLGDQRVVFNHLGRLRAATAGNGFLYLTTSNNTADEKVLRVPFDGQTAAPADCSGGPSPSPPAADVTRPALSVRMPSRHRVLRRGVRFTLAPSEPVAVRVTGRVLIGGRLTSVRLRRTSRLVPAARRTSVRTRLSPYGRRVVGRALARRRRVSARLIITGIDAAGNRRTTVRRVRLVR